MERPNLKSRFYIDALCFSALLCSVITQTYSESNSPDVLDEISIIDVLPQEDVFFEIIEPKELSYTYRIKPAYDFGAPFNESFHMMGANLIPVDPPCGCSWPRNAESLKGSIALVERGECSFLSKALKMEEFGALAVIVTHNDKNYDDYVEMAADKTNRETSIPSGFLDGQNGYMIRTTLKKLRRKSALINIPVNLTYVSIGKVKQPPWFLW